MSTIHRRPSSIGIYHVIVRGVGNQRIFEDKWDYLKFLEILRKYKEKLEFSLLAYCIMDNHVHLLIKPGNDDLAQIFLCVNSRYAIWFNTKYERPGHLFQSRYKSKPVNNTLYLLTVIRYIHQNPVKAAICSDPSQYEYSSYRDYFDNLLIDSDIVLSYVSKEFFMNWNMMENDDKCMDIDDGAPRPVSDERAADIMHDVSGCRNATEFQKLNADVRDEALREMKRSGVSGKQASRITGISYGIVRRVVRGY